MKRIKQYIVKVYRFDALVQILLKIPYTALECLRNVLTVFQALFQRLQMVYR